MHTYIYPCIHTYIHAYIHISMHTYIYPCIHTYMLRFIRTSMAPAAPPGKPRCLVSEGVWCLKVYDIISGPDRWQGSGVSPAAGGENFWAFFSPSKHTIYVWKTRRRDPPYYVPEGDLPQSLQATAHLFRAEVPASAIKHRAGVRATEEVGFITGSANASR